MVQSKRSLLAWSPWLTGGICLTATLTLIVRFGLGWPLAAALVLSSGLIRLALIDLQSQQLPDTLTLPLLWMGLGTNLSGLFTTLDSAVLGAMTGYLLLRGTGDVYYVFTGREGLGRGDAKLTAALGAWLGWTSLPLLLFIAAGLHTLMVIGIVLITGQKWRTPQPAGPAFALAGWIGLVGAPHWSVWSIPGGF